MNSAFLTLRRAIPTAVLTLVSAVMAGCAADKPEPPPRPSVHWNTIADADLGDELTITAGVVRRLDALSFVVRDVDLPTEGLLVVARVPVVVRPPILVTVRGTVRIFHYVDRADDRLGPSSLFETFEGRRVVIADSVMVWDGPTPSSSVAGA